MIKKALLLSLSLLLALLLCNCSGKKTEPQPSASPSSNEETVSLSSPSEPAGAVFFEQDQVTLKAGGSLQLSTISERNEKLSFLSDNPDLLYVDQTGKVTAFEEGTATVRVRTASGGTASCSVTIAGKEEDPFDKLVLREEDRMYYAFFYGTGIVFTDQKETVFTPAFWEVDINELNCKDYTFHLRFSKLSPDGERIYTFPSITLTPDINEKGNVSLLLQSNDFDSGFCPESGARYDIELAVCTANTSRVIAHGVYRNVGEVPTIVQYSAYYAPTPLPGLYDKIKGQTTVQYLTTTGGQVSGKSLQILFDGEQSSSVKAEAGDGYEFFMWSDGVTSPERTDTASGKNAQLTAYFLRCSDNIQSVPDIYLFTESGKPVEKKTYENATLIIRGSGDRRTDITVTTQIKGRGNSSWNGEADQSDYDSKNSYRLKLDEKEQLLGIGDSKNRDWVLNSNKFDLSGLRNFLIWELADRMGSFSYVPDCSFAQLYVNGQYRGLYMVTEFIEIANDRVELTESEANDKVASADKDYFLEIDFRGTMEGLPYFCIDGYGAASNGNEREFLIKNPCTVQDKMYIWGYVQSCHDAIVSADRAEIEKLIDVPSFVDMYILEELSKDVDVGAASCYLYKKADGKLTFTAPWDYDFGFGTFEKAVSYEDMISINKKGCTWFAALLEQEWFRDAVIARMNELEQAMANTMTAVEEKANEIKPAVDESAAFWKMYGTRYHPYVDRQVSSALNSYEEHVDFLKNWTANRWQYMIEFISAYGAE